MTGRRFGGGRLLKRKDGAYVGVWTDASGTRRRRVLSTDRRVAERALALAVRDRDLATLGLKSEDAQLSRLSELAEKYLPDLETRTSKRHFQRIQDVLGRVIAAVGDPTVRDLNAAAVMSYRQRRLREGAARRTVNLEAGALGAMLRWSLLAGLVGANPIAALKPLPTGPAYEVHTRRALGADEITAFLRAAEDADRDAVAHLGRRPGQARRYHGEHRRPRIPQLPLWRALLFSGARWTELVSCRWADYDATARLLTLRASTTKNRRGRVLPLMDAVADDLERLRGLHAALYGREPLPTEPLFLGPAGKPILGNETRARWRFRQVLKRAGIARVDALGRWMDVHALRHSYATLLARSGVALTDAQRLLGHSTPVLTARVYVHAEVEDLRRAVEKVRMPAISAGIIAAASG